MGIDIPIVEGGFGKNCRIVSDKIKASLALLLETKSNLSAIFLSETVSLRRLI